MVGISILEFFSILVFYDAIRYTDTKKRHLMSRVDLVKER